VNYSELTDDELLAEQKKVKSEVSKFDIYQLSAKISINSLYGALGNQWFRYYDIRLAEAVTLSGQLVIRWIEEKLNTYFNKLLKTLDVQYVIASDTDSVYLNMSGLVNKINQLQNAGKEQIIDFLDKVCKEKLEPFISDCFDELAEYLNTPKRLMNMDREVIADKGIWTSKKRYILNVYDNEGIRYVTPVLKIMGIETVRSSTPNFCREKLKDAIRLILSADEDSIINFIDKTEREFKISNTEDISFPRSVNGLDKYKSSVLVCIKGTPVQVRGALVHNHLLRTKKLYKKYPYIKEGEKIKFLYLKMPNPINSYVISYVNILPKEFNVDGFIDYTKQFETSFKEPLRSILGAVGWNMERVASLSDFL